MQRNFGTPGPVHIERALIPRSWADIDADISAREAHEQAKRFIGRLVYAFGALAVAMLAPGAVAIGYWIWRL